jgi:hypothetical protein
MNRICWWLVDIVSRMLEPGEREVVRGDFAESSETGGQMLRGLLGLVVRRQAALWKGWRPWLALLGLVAPVGVLFGRFSFQLNMWFGWLARQFMTIWSQGVRVENALPLTDDIVKMVCGCVLVFSWAWTGGFVLGSLLRRTAWLYASLSCLVWWVLRGVPLLHLALFVFMMQMALILLPFLWGVHQGIHLGSLRVSRAVLFAAAFTILTLVIQVENSREQLAFKFWSSGGMLGGRLAWDPQPLPFAVILWQFGFLTVTTNWRRWRGEAASV